MTRAQPTSGAVEVIVRYAYPGVRFSQGRVVVIHAKPHETHEATRGGGGEKGTLMTWREALADVNDEAGEEGDAIGSAAGGTMSWRDALAEVNNGDVYDADTIDEEGSVAFDDADSAGDGGETGATSITGAEIVAALEADGVDVGRWRARVALTCEKAATRQHYNPEKGASAAGGAALKKPIFFTHVGWRRLEDHDVVTFDPGATGLLVQLEDGLIASTTPPKTSPYERREGDGKHKRRGKNRKKPPGDGWGPDDDESADETTPGAVAAAAAAAAAAEKATTHRAANFWKLDDADAEGGGNNPYAGKRSSGTDVHPKDDAGAGYFGIGIVKPKHDANVGTLWRSAWQLGAAFIFTVAARFRYEASDTTQAHKQLPLYKYDEWGDFASNSPHGAVWVAIEMGGTPLQDFVHPPRAVYVLGSEDNGLNRPIVEACQCHVALPKWAGRSSSYNVAMAGTLVMYDRMLKQLAAGHARVPTEAAEDER